MEVIAATIETTDLRVCIFGILCAGLGYAAHMFMAAGPPRAKRRRSVHTRRHWS